MKQASTRGMRAAIRLGYVARGVVYGLIGTLALMWSLRQSGGSVTGGEGAVERISEQTWGEPLLWAIAIGLSCYAAWNMFRALVDPEHHGHGRKGVIQRIAHGVSAASQGFLAAYAFQLAAGGPDGGHNSSLTKLINLPGGRIAVAVAGLIVVGFGLFELHRAYKNRVEHEYRGGLPAKHRTLVLRVARVGVAARGFVFPLIGISLIAAAIAADASHAHTFGDVLHDIARQAYGRILLGVVAVGLIAYGTHMFCMAIYARFTLQG